MGYPLFNACIFLIKNHRKKQTKHTQKREREREMAFLATDETALREKVLQLHARELSEFDTESLLASIEGILNHVMPGVDATGEVSLFFYL